MKVSSVWQEEKEMKNDSIRERGKGRSAGHYPKKQCFVNKYVVCQDWRTLKYPHCGKSLLQPIKNTMMLCHVDRNL